MWRAGPYTYGRGGRPRPPAPRTHRDDAGGRCVRAGRRGRRPLPTPHSRGVQDHAHHVARRAVYMVGADVPGRPPPARTRTMPVDDASTRAAEDVGPYQHRTSHDTQRRALTARAGPRAPCGAQGRIHGRGGRPRPPAPRTGTTPVDDASTRAAEDVGPYQHRTAVMCRAAQPWRAGPYTYGRGGRPRPPAPRTHKDDAGGRCVRAGRRGRRPLPTPHSRNVQGRAHIMWRAGRRCARHTYRCGISSPV